MAFDFLGTFTKNDIESLKSYLLGELSRINSQINNMILEINKLEKTRNQLDDYGNQNNIKIKWYDSSFDRRTHSQYDDTDSAILVQTVKEPFYCNLKIKENFEHKMKKIRDLIEQTEQQVHLLRIQKTEFETNFEKINSLFDSRRPYLTVEEGN